MLAFFSVSVLALALGVVFAIYLIFVPPTSLYHMFLEPDLSEAVRVVGSLLSLFIALPTILVFVVIVAHGSGLCPSSPWWRRCISSPR